jgi:hypothetical protein
MGFAQTFMRIRAWWFLRIAKNATIPPDVGEYLIALREHHRWALEEIEQRRRAIIDYRAAEGKCISTEAALKGVLELRATYDGPDREQYVAELDQIIEEFRRKHGTQIPVGEAYSILKELENRLGGVE